MIRATGKQRGKTSGDPASLPDRTETRILLGEIQSRSNIRRRMASPPPPAACNSTLITNHGIRPLNHGIRQPNHGIRPLNHGIHEYSQVHACQMSALVAMSGDAMASGTRDDAMDVFLHRLHDAMASSA
ncbi:MAG: hypothetical protein AB7I59_01840 [Geminicoccaceae bacterium]